MTSQTGSFHAVNTQEDVLGISIGDHIMFDTVKLNIGGGFRELHGVFFIAPESGHCFPLP